MLSMRRLEHLIVREMKEHLNERFFLKEIDRMYHKLRYDNELVFVTSGADFKFLLPHFGRHTCHGAIFIHNTYKGGVGAFMDSEAWPAVVEFADGQECVAYDDETARKHRAVLHQGIMFIYANYCVFFTEPILGS